MPLVALSATSSQMPPKKLPTSENTSFMASHILETSFNMLGAPLASPFKIALIISGIDEIISMQITGIAFMSAPNSCIPHSTTSPCPDMSAVIIVDMISGKAFTSASIIVGKASTIPIRSCIAPSIICGKPLMSKSDIPVISVGIESVRALIISGSA